VPDRTFLDWPFLDDAHRALAASVEAWADRELARLARPATREGVDALARDLVRRLAAGGWLAHAAPAPRDGGAPRLDVRAICLIRETLARRHGLADFAFAMQGLGSGAITLAGTPEQQSNYLTAVGKPNADRFVVLDENTIDFGPQHHLAAV